MARKPATRPTKAEEHAALATALQQLEAVVAEIDLNLPDELRANVRRRLDRISRALRNGPAEARKR